MSDSKYNLINNVLGWLMFAIASIVYLMTIESTVSLWDCGEFIAGSYKLEVVHPPGAPFFLMLNHLFTMFAPDPEWVPIIVNASSAFASSFTILFLFWTITILAKRLVIKDLSKAGLGEMLTVMGSGFIGALAFTFSDPDHSVNEYRHLTFGLSKFNRLLVVSHAERKDKIRIISARPITKKERKIYEEGKIR